MERAKRYMVPVDEETVELAKRISKFAQREGLPSSYTAIMRQALADGLSTLAKKFDIAT